MNKILMIAAFVAAFTTNISAQVWKPIKSQYKAKYRVYVTTNKAEANIIGYRVDKEYDVLRPGLIYLAPIWYSRGTEVFFVENNKDADLILYWTTNKKEVSFK